MEVLRRAPMLGVLAALVSGLAVYERFGVWAFIIFAPAIFVSIMFCSYEYNLPEQWHVFLFVMIFTLLCSWRIYHEISKAPEQELKLKNITGTVTNLRQWGKMYAAVIETESGGSKFVARFHFPTFLEGTRIKFDGETRNFKSAQKPNDFDEGKYWRARGAKAWISIKNPKELPEKFSIALLRRKISRFLAIHIPDLTGKYLKAAWLGERSSSLNAEHIKWGTSHLLAVSGFHVGILILCAGFFFKKNFFYMSLILWGYVFLTGAAPSAIRAALMIQIALLSRVFGRKINALNSVCAAAVVLLIYSPFLFWDIGWRLSVISALTITALNQKKSALPLMSCVIFFTTFSETAYIFKSVPLVGIFLNIFAPFYFSFALTIASIGVFLKFINFPLSGTLMTSIEGIFLLWEKTADIFAVLIPYNISWNYFTAWVGAGIFIFLICRNFNFSKLKTLLITMTINFAAFLIFL